MGEERLIGSARVSTENSRARNLDLRSVINDLRSVINDPQDELLMGE